MAMDVMVVGRDVDRARAAVRAAGLRLVQARPDVVLCHGGDGSLLRAERQLPGVPKLPVRVNGTCQPCQRHELESVLGRLAEGALEAETLPKLRLEVGRLVLLAMNDVVLRNVLHTSAVRFRVLVDGAGSGVITGDGLVLTTPFGSSGYFRSVSGRIVESGLGLAFNNATVPREARMLDGGAQVCVELVRGPAALAWDNDPRWLPLHDGHRFTVRRADEQALGLGLDALRCQRCVQADGTPFNPH